MFEFFFGKFPKRVYLSEQHQKNEEAFEKYLKEKKMSEKKPHKHAEAIKAWADGQAIEGKRHGGDCWMELPENPAWNTNWEYRIKPGSRSVLIKKFALNESREGVYWLSTWVDGFNAGPCLHVTIDNGEMIKAEVL